MGKKRKPLPAEPTKVLCLRDALALRERFFSQPYYRLVYGDSDLLPGLVIDRFGDYLEIPKLHPAR